MTTDLLAIVVTDLVDSTATRTKIGEERADELQHIHDTILRNAVAAERGEVVKGTGDGIMATFRSASDALAAAVAMQQQLDAYSRSPSAIAPIPARVAIAAGDVVHQDGDIFGSAVIEAARLCAAADRGQILCSELVRTLTRGRGGFAFDLVGFLELKGLSEPVAACSVRWDILDAGAALALPLPEDLVGAARLPFVGREAEIHAAVGLALAAERAAVLWVLGEPGVGKSRFAAEVAGRAYEAGSLVLFGRNDELSANPFQPFINALRWYVAHLDTDVLASRLGSDPAPLVRLVPEIGTRLPSLLDEVGGATEVEQYRLFESVWSWLATEAAPRPVILVVDDVHWADRPTLAMLAHLLRQAAPARLFVLATARDTDPDSSEMLAGLVDDLARTGRSRPIKLGGLNVEEVAELVSSLDLSEPESITLAERIAGETAGNALFVGAVLAGLSAGGSGSDELPADVRSAVRHRVRRLEPQAQDLLQVAAIVGIEFWLGVAATASGRQEHECLGCLEQAVNAGLVDEIGVDRFRFTHALVRDALAGELSVSRRARLHGLIAEAIEQQLGHELDEHLRLLAHHCAASQKPPLMTRAIDYARRSAERAISQLAFDAAVDDLSFGLEAAQRLGNFPAGDRFELLMAKGSAQVMGGRSTSAAATFLATAELAGQLEDWERFARAAIEHEEASWRPGLMGHQAVALLRQATSHDLSPALNILAEVSLVRALHYSGDSASAGRLSQDVVRRARRLGNPAVLARALAVGASTAPFDRPYDIREKIAMSREALELMDDSGNTTSALIANASVIEHFLAIADIDEARRSLACAEQLAERTGLRFDQYVVRSQRQVLNFADGDLAGAEAQADALLEFGQQVAEDVSGVHGVHLFLIRREQDRLAELAALVRAVLRLNPTAAMWRPGLIALLAEVGLVEEARNLLAEYGPDDFAKLPRDAMYAGAVCLLAEAAARVGALDAGQTLERLLCPWGTTGIWLGTTVGFLGSAARYLGLLAGLGGRLDDADARYAEALEFNRRAQSPVWISHTLADRAELQLRAGNQQQARTLATEARLLAERHGLLAVARQLDAIGLE